MNNPLTSFPHLNEKQLMQYAQMETLYREWNARINVISRKDIDQFQTHHLLHSLSVARIVSFIPGTTVMDAGTGGGFPGIPLAVMFPEVEFHLVDSIGKKIKVVEAVKSELGLQNVTTRNIRFEEIRESFEFITGRAVSNLPLFCSMVKKNVKKKGHNSIPNGILYLTGGETDQALISINATTSVWNLADFFGDSFFTTKKLIHLSGFL
jgi:16S rRNA (guanine527-N7)-methyltransferase